MTPDLKDPFAEDARKAAPRPAASSEPSPSLTKGKARRNLHILGLILLAAAVVTWMFWPQSLSSVAAPAPVSKADLPEPGLAGQRLLRDLQEDASASTPAAEGRSTPAPMPTTECLSLGAPASTRDSDGSTSTFTTAGFFCARNFPAPAIVPPVPAPATK